MPSKSWTELLTEAGDAGNYDPLPDGDYDFIVGESKAQQASTGKQMYVITARVETGPYANKPVFHNFVLSPDNPNALGFFFRNMGVFGLSREFFASNPSDFQVAEALKGRRFRAQIGTRKWQGQDRNEIKAFFPPAGQGVGAPTAPPQAPGFSAAPPAVAPAPPAPAPAPAAPPPVQQSFAPAPPAAPVGQAPTNGNVSHITPPTQTASEAPPPPPPPPLAAAPAPTPEAPPAPQQPAPEPQPQPEPATAGVGAGAVPPPPPF